MMEKKRKKKKRRRKKKTRQASGVRLREIIDRPHQRVLDDDDEKLLS